jgi:hypothetical protein
MYYIIERGLGRVFISANKMHLSPNLFYFQTDILYKFILCKKQHFRHVKGNVYLISQDGVMVLVQCTSSQCAWPLYEVILYFNHKSSSNGPDNRKQWKSNKGQ